MSIDDSNAQHRIDYINAELKDIDFNLEKYFSNYNIDQLSKDISKESSTGKNSDLKLKDISENDKPIYNKRYYYELIEICNQLWVINELFNELKHSKDFDSKVLKSVKLRNKIVDFKKQLGFGFEIKALNDLEDKLDEINNQLIEECKETFQEYLKIDSETLNILFTFKINEVSFDDFLKSCSALISTDIYNFFNISNLFNVWIGKSLNELDTSNADVKLSDNTLSLTLEKGENKGNSLLLYTKSVNQIIEFFNEFSMVVKNESFGNIRYIISKEILKSVKTKIFLKENVYPLIIDKLNFKEGEESEVSAIAELYKVSKNLSSKSWSKDEICELEFWIDDLTTSWTDNLVDLTIDDLKIFIIDLINGKGKKLSKELICIQLNDVINTDTFTEKEKPKLQPTEEEDKWSEKWGDDEDDGWGADDDLDLEINFSNDLKEGEEKEEEKHKEEEEEEEADGWDAWDEDIDIDEEPEVTNKKIISENSLATPSFKYSVIVVEVMKIMENYMKNYEDLRNTGGIHKEQIEESEILFKHGFKKICTSYFMMTNINTEKIYGMNGSILFYNDFNKILEECYTKYGIELTLCFQMNSKFINRSVDKYSKVFLNLISDYDDTLWNDSFNDDNKFKSLKQELIIRFDNEFNKSYFELIVFKDLNTQLINNTLITIIFQIFNTVCEKILLREDISSNESECLSQLIEEIEKIVLLKTEELNMDINKIQSYNKLEQINLILSNHLKNILEYFYDAKLYEMETNELIKLIKSLFVESPQRTDVINQILTAREEF